MRWVVTHAETADRTRIQKECRAWLKENRQAFMMKLADLEKAFLEFQREANESAAQEIVKRAGTAVKADEASLEQRLRAGPETLEKKTQSSAASPDKAKQ
jgi:hypothetical protein